MVANPGMLAGSISSGYPTLFKANVSLSNANVTLFKNIRPSSASSLSNTNNSLCKM